MSIEFRAERDWKLDQQIQKLLSSAPEYIRSFYEHMHNGRREMTTQAAYIRDIVSYLGYLRETIPMLRDAELKDIPIVIFSDLNVKDMNEYRTYLSNVAQISNSSSKKKFAAISAFYKYINAEGFTTNNPMTNFELPAINKHRIIKLDSELSKKLLDGILRNDLYLTQTVNGEKPLPIEESVWIKREPLVLRNYAIACLFLGSGLRVSELVGLDLPDINFRQNSLNIVAKGGDEIQVYFGAEVAKALHAYLDGSPLPDDVMSKYSDEQIQWCRNHLTEPGFHDKLRDTFPEQSQEFYADLTMITASMRRQGRDGLKPERNCQAVFITGRGKRMGVRMVELMIKEYVKTYLPDYDDRAVFSPHKLRATCATRILNQTGNIQLAATQLNHKGVEVTAAFYSELQKEKQKETIRNLDIEDW